MSVLKLDSVEQASAAHQKTLEYFDSRLAQLRDQLEKDQSEETTAKTRGRIAEIKEFKRQLEPLPEIRPVSHKAIE